MDKFKLSEWRWNGSYYEHKCAGKIPQIGHSPATQQPNGNWVCGSCYAILEKSNTILGALAHDDAMRAKH